LTREDKLIQRIEQGDLGAADELIAMFYPEILRYCLWHAPNRSLAEDAAQETFLKVIRYFDRYTHKGQFKAFLYQVAANTCIDMRRKNRCPDVSLEDSAIEPVYAEPAFDAIHADMALRQLIGSLPKDLQEIVLLRFGQDLTLQEIAKILHMPLRTVQSKLRRALKKLKAQIH
jgi:RNA polymerase sigma-70 factor (ECF subfamily)